MRGGAWICGECVRAIPNPYDRYEKRIEFRNCHTQSRYRTYVIAHLCRECVDKERPVSDIDQGQLEIL